MKQHLSDGQIDKFISRTLPPSELLEVDDHLAACEICMQKVGRLTDRSVSKLQDQLFARDMDNDHLSYDLMSGFVDDTLDVHNRESVEIHRQSCAECSSEIDSLINLRAAITADTEPRERQTQVQPSWIARILASSYFKIAVPAAIILLIGLFLWYFPSVKPADVAEVEQPLTPPAPPANTDNSPSTNGVNSQQPQKIVASLNDAGGRIELDDTGKITGLPGQEFAQEVRTAFKNQTVDIPSDVLQLRSANGVLMGNSENGAPFKLVGPVGKVVEARRPSFTWQPLKDADSYTVGIYDEKFEQVALSPTLQTTKWTPNTELKRGRIYQWQVTAIRNGEEVRSPVRPAPAAKFKVVDGTSIAAIENARRMTAHSHLVLGIAYAKAGLFDEAEREFQILQKNNPDSKIALKLLAEILAAK